MRLSALVMAIAAPALMGISTTLCAPVHGVPAVTETIVGSPTAADGLVNLVSGPATTPDAIPSPTVFEPLSTAQPLASTALNAVVKLPVAVMLTTAADYASTTAADEPEASIDLEPWTTESESTKWGRFIFTLPPKLKTTTSTTSIKSQCLITAVFAANPLTAPRSVVAISVPSDDLPSALVEPPASLTLATDSVRPASVDGTVTKTFTVPDLTVTKTVWATGTDDPTMTGRPPWTKPFPHSVYTTGRSTLSSSVPMSSAWTNYTTKTSMVVLTTGTAVRMTFSTMVLSSLQATHNNGSKVSPATSSSAQNRPSSSLNMPSGWRPSGRPSSRSHMSMPSGWRPSGHPWTWTSRGPVHTGNNPVTTVTSYVTAQVTNYVTSTVGSNYTAATSPWYVTTITRTRSVGWKDTTMTTKTVSVSVLTKPSVSTITTNISTATTDTLTTVTRDTVSMVTEDAVSIVTVDKVVTVTVDAVSFVTAGPVSTVFNDRVATVTDLSTVTRDVVSLTVVKGPGVTVTATATATAQLGDSEPDRPSVVLPSTIDHSDGHGHAATVTALVTVTKIVPVPVSKTAVATVTVTAMATTTA